MSKENETVNNTYWELPLTMLFVTILGMYWVNQAYKPVEHKYIVRTTKDEEITLPEGCSDYFIRQNLDFVTCYGVFEGKKVKFQLTKQRDE